MIFRMTLITLVFAAVGLGHSERGGAMAETADSDRVSRPVGNDGGSVQVAQLANRRPVVNRAIANQTSREGDRFTFVIPANTFRDPDGDRLRITAQESVNWLSFNQSTRTMSGTPRSFAAPAAVRVRATDPHGASAVTSFRVSIRPRPLADDAPPSQSTPSPDVNGTSDSTQPSISADGRFVAHVFENVETDPPEQSILVRDFTIAGFSGRGSLTVAGPREFEPGDSSGGSSFSSPSISANGRIVAFVAQTPPEASTQGVVVRVVRIADNDPLKLETKFVQLILRSDDSEARGDLVRSTDVSLSADGRLVAFEQGTRIVVVNIAARKRLAIRNASSPFLSGNGRRIAYEEATDFDERDILVATLDTDRMRAIDTTVIGSDIDFGPFSSNPVVSRNGRFVAFESDASDLVLCDTNGVRDIFVFNVPEGTLSRANVDIDGDQADSDSFNPSLSGDGLLLAFDTSVPNVDAPQVLARELDLEGEPRGELRIVSVDSDGNPGNLGGGGGSFGPSLSADGRFVTFQSTSTNLTADAAENEGTAVFVAPAFPDYAPVVDFAFPLDPRDHNGTKAVLVLDAPIQCEIDPAFEADWYRVELTQGQSYRFVLQADNANGTPLGDPLLEIRGGDGAVVASDDNSGGGLNGLDALVDFTAPSDGTFFVAARGVGEAIGDYVLTGDQTSPAAAVSR